MERVALNVPSGADRTNPAGSQCADGRAQYVTYSQAVEYCLRTNCLCDSSDILKAPI
jgi:hypothetical protein